MQLRAHPKMNWEGFSNWPPAWAGAYGAEDVFPGEEEGVLTGVEMIETGNTLPRHLVLTMMHLGKGSSAVLFCDGFTFVPFHSGMSSPTLTFSQISAISRSARL